MDGVIASILNKPPCLVSVNGSGHIVMTNGTLKPWHGCLFNAKAPTHIMKKKLQSMLYTTDPCFVITGNPEQYQKDAGVGSSGSNMFSENVSTTSNTDWSPHHASVATSNTEWSQHHAPVATGNTEWSAHDAPVATCVTDRYKKGIPVLQNNSYYMDIAVSVKQNDNEQNVSHPQISNNIDIGGEEKPLRVMGEGHLIMSDGSRKQWQGCIHLPLLEAVQNVEPQSSALSTSTTATPITGTSPSWRPEQVTSTITFTTGIRTSGDAPTCKTEGGLLSQPKKASMDESASDESQPRNTDMDHLPCDESQSWKTDMEQLPSSESQSWKTDMDQLSSNESQLRKTDMDQLPCDEFKSWKTDMDQLPSRESQPWKTDMGQLPCDESKSWKANMDHLPSNESQPSEIRIDLLPSDYSHSCKARTDHLPSNEFQPWKTNINEYDIKPSLTLVDHYCMENLKTEGEYMQSNWNVGNVKYEESSNDLNSYHMGSDCSHSIDIKQEPCEDYNEHGKCTCINTEPGDP